MKRQLQFIMEGGAVVRYHARPGIKPDTDAHHMHGVALLCSLLVGSDEITGRTLASVNLLMAALTHDLAEQQYSDVSAPTKRAVPGLADTLNELENTALKKYWLDYTQYLSAEELVVLKLADSFDGMLYCLRELALGNRNVLLIWRRWCKYLESLAGDLPVEIALRASQMYESIKEIYRETISPEGPSFDVFQED